MRGYFGIGVQGISKAHNLGAVLRTAHAFGASFAFTVAGSHEADDINLTDTSRSDIHLPLYEWETIGDFTLPKNCVLVGVELTEDSIDLPSFQHPRNCAYILGPEMGSLSDDVIARCEHVVRIPTKFCINVSLAAALTLYDRTISLGAYPERPIRPGGPEMKGWEPKNVRYDSLMMSNRKLQKP